MKTKRLSSYGIKFLINLHLSLNVDIITQPLINLVNIMAEIIKGNNNLASMLQFEVEKLDYSKLKAKKGNQDAQSGKTMFQDLHRMNFVINGKPINQNLTNMLRDGATSTSLDENEIMRHGIEGLHFFCIGFNNKHLLQRKEDTSENYRPFLVEAFKGIFEYVKTRDQEAKVPSDAIIQELITSCNQAGYQAIMPTNVFFNPEVLACLTQCDLILENTTSTIHLDCYGSNCIKLKIDMETSILNFSDSTKKVASFPSSLEFKLESHENEIKYTDGKLSLIIPKELLEDKGLLSRVIEAIKILLEKAFGIKIGKENTNMIEHDFDNPKSSVTDPKIEEVHGEGIVVA